ncbi:hypothetical protein T484DRAFT_1823485 [Baffinella frigidus]|nr:hypothetical protein T484DRAFT_1823485 [Cryptophyta sp. CCMP2293]
MAVRSKEEQLLALPEVGENADGDAGEGDEEVRDRVQRSSELLDCNASMRHLVTVASSMLRDRAAQAGYFDSARKDLAALGESVAEECAAVHGRIALPWYFDGARKEVAALGESVAEECAAVHGRIAGATQDRANLRKERVEAEDKLAKSEAALTDRLDRLLTRKRALEEELETVGLFAPVVVHHAARLQKPLVGGAQARARGGA